MKKKILAALVMLLAIVPAVVVKAASTYSALDYINFLTNEADNSAYQAGDYSVGFSTYYVGTTNKTDDKGNAYLKVLSGGTSGSTGGLVTTTGGNYKAGEIYKNYVEFYKNKFESPMVYFENSEAYIDLMSLEDIVSAFGATKGNDDTVGNETYSIELNERKKEILNFLTPTSKTAYVYTSTKANHKVDTTYDAYYAIKVEKDEAGKITAASIVAIADEGMGSTTGIYEFGAFVLYLNETYTCKEDVDYNYACYSCPADNNTTEYVWKVAGTQDSKCTVVKTVGSKDKCVKNAKTGVESYLVPAAIVLGVCAIVLTVVKRKDAFRAI